MCPDVIRPAEQLSGAVLNGATSVRLCAFSDGTPTKQRPAIGVVEAAPAAAVLALLLRNLPAAPSRQQCGQLTPEVLLSFHYRSGPDVAVPLVSYGCPQPIAFIDGAAHVVDNALAQLLVASAGSYDEPGPRVPDLVGMPISAASVRGFAIATDGEEIDSDVAPGTVLAQYPPAGSGAIGNQIDVLTAARQTRSCTARELTLDYQGEGAGEGSDFGTITISDRGPAPCELTGPITIVGLAQSGRTDTDQLSYPVAPTLILRPGRYTASLQLGAEYRDDVNSPNGLCMQNRVIPSRWRLGFLGSTLTVANASVDVAYPQFSSLLTCYGQLDTVEPVSLTG